MTLSLEDGGRSVSWSCSWEGTGDWSLRWRSCFLAANGRRWSKDKGRFIESGRREQEHDLDLLRGLGVEDLEQDERRRRRLGDNRLVRGDVRRALGDRRANEECERHLGDRDTSLGGLLVMPAGEGRREGEGHVLHQRREAGERLWWRSVWEGEVWWCWGPGPRLLMSGEREHRHGLRLTCLGHLDWGEGQSDGCLHDCPSLLDRDLSPIGLLDREPPSALFELGLCGTHGDALSPEELGGRSAPGPIIRVGTVKPMDDWGGATPKRSIISSFMEESREAFMFFIQSLSLGNVWGITVGTWEGVTTTWEGGTVTWDDGCEGALDGAAVSLVEGFGGPTRSLETGVKGVDAAAGSAGSREKGMVSSKKSGQARGGRKGCFEWQVLASAKQGEVQGRQPQQQGRSWRVQCGREVIQELVEAAGKGEWRSPVWAMSKDPEAERSSDPEEVSPHTRSQNWGPGT